MAEDKKEKPSKFLPKVLTSKKILKKLDPINEPKKPKKVIKKKKPTPKTTPKTDGFGYTLPDGRSFKLTLKERIFCLKYLELSGNGTSAIIDAGYDVQYKNKEGKPTGRINYNLAAVMAKENLRKPHIFNFITLKLDEYGYNDENVDKQNLYLINQYEDLAAKGRGIDIYNKVKGRYAPQKVEIEFGEFDNIPKDELERIAGVKTTGSNHSSKNSSVQG